LGSDNIAPERLLRQLDDHDQYFDGLVEFGPFGRGVLSDRGAQRLGQSLLGAAHRRIFLSIKISTFYMTADAAQYSALLDFFKTAEYEKVELFQVDPPALNATPAPPPPGMLAAIERIVIAMRANRQPAAAELELTGVCLTIKTLHLALQCSDLTLGRCQMESQPQLLAELPDDTVDRDDSPEQGCCLQLNSNNDWIGILQAATMVKTNVTSLQLFFTDPIVGRLDLSSVTGFITAQPNDVDLAITYPFNPADGVAIVEHIVADLSTQCPGLRRLLIRLDNALARVNRMQFPRLTELVSNSVLSKLAIEDFSDSSVLSREQKKQIRVITERNGVIPSYLQTTNLLKEHGTWRLKAFLGDEPIVVYAKDGEDRRKHQYVLSHALSQAAVHPIFFSHVYEFVRNHVDELFGGPEDQQH
jgi:hypothetical protein